jgi:thioredoxin-like negative regulator of GroEL
MRIVSILLLSLCLAPLAAVAETPAVLTQALATAKARQQPVLLDFHAPWCYSCYFMQKIVLNGPEWDKTQRETVVLDLDADSPEGAAIRDQYGVKALPNYVVINAEGEELGRINAERTRAQFYPELAAILKRNTTLDALREQAAKGALPAMRGVLATHLARNEAQPGLDWFAALPAATRDAAAHDPEVQRTLARLSLKLAQAHQNPAACLASAEAAMQGSLDCESAYDLDAVLSCTESAPAQRKAFLAAAAPRFESLLRQHTLTPRQGCADARSIIFANVDLADARDDQAGKKAVLTRAIVYFEPKVKKDVKADRNAADNLRVLYEAAGETARFDALLLRQIAAYPDDYIYANRYARALAKRGEHERALPYFAQAAEHAYGINRLKNAQEQAKSLLALKRAEEARAVVAAALKANGPWFPDEAAKLKALVS